MAEAELEAAGPVAAGEWAVAAKAPRSAAAPAGALATEAVVASATVAAMNAVITVMQGMNAIATQRNPASEVAPRHTESVPGTAAAVQHRAGPASRSAGKIPTVPVGTTACRPAVCLGVSLTRATSRCRPGTPGRVREVTSTCR